MKKVLGKIKSAYIGGIDDYPFLFGPIFQFDLSDGTGVGCGGKYCFNAGANCRWENAERRKQACEKAIDTIREIMESAKVNDFSKLVGKPVEVTIDKMTFQDFRILTEVL